eukprot:350388-Chlamydomonas_euryale.AAC.8
MPQPLRGDDAARWTEQAAPSACDFIDTAAHMWGPAPACMPGACGAPNPKPLSFRGYSHGGQRPRNAQPAGLPPACAVAGAAG